ncbi:hypothetical protein L210DRAFT_1058385 [Boletus edulis BED1]|uniref:Uncharacterized protein n=1 Tax=Boletus edulis BED1 TaxID=1328754 RepID=A0AAD4G9N5_BOLED|nr:hypothetical protein L210DRAFT_1058385 [Boletus edulis BED1]
MFEIGGTDGHTSPLFLAAGATWQLQPPLSGQPDIDLGEDCRPDVYLLLVPHVDPWRAVKAEFRSYKDMGAFLHAVSRPTVSAAFRLTTLQLYVEHSYEYRNNSSPPEDFTLFSGSAPYLERLTLCEVSINWDQPWISSASNLTHFEFKCNTDILLSWAQFSTVLRGAPALRTLKLNVSGNTGDLSDWYIASHAGNVASDPYHPIHLPNLTDFFVTLFSSSDPTGLFRKLHMPSLTSLALAIPHVDQDPVEYLAFPFLAPPSPDNAPPNVLNKLKDLLITDSLYSCQAMRVERLYSKLRNLRSLHIVSGHGCSMSRYLPYVSKSLVAPARNALYLPAC